MRIITLDIPAGGVGLGALRYDVRLENSFYKTMPGTRSKGKKRSSKRRSNDVGISRENMYNEVDEFHEQRDQIMLKNAGVGY